MLLTIIDMQDLTNSTMLSACNTPANPQPPEWSPDGRRIAYVTAGDGEGYVNVYDFGQEILQQTRKVGVALYQSVSFSGDGTYLLFVSQASRDPEIGERFMHERGDNKVIMMSVDDLSSRVLYEESSDKYLDIRNPTWSPDGRMVSYEKESKKSREIWLMNSQGKHHRMLVTNAYYPVWSPDTSKIACINRDSLSVADVQSGQIAPIVSFRKLGPTKPVSVEGPPAWSPDGEQIAFYCSTDNGDGLWLVNADGGDLKEVYHSPPTFVKDASKEKESEKESQLARSYWYLGGSIMLLILILIVMIVLVRIKG